MSDEVSTGAPVVFEPADEMQRGFLESPADIAIFGGIAGSGKTGAALVCAGQHADLPGYGAVIFRRIIGKLTGPGSVWQQSRKFFPMFGKGGEQVTSPVMLWRWQGDSSVEFRGIQHDGDEQSQQGKRYNCAVFEEVTEFTAPMFWYVFSRIDDLMAMSDDPKGRWKSGDTLVKGHMRATCNPDASSFVRQLIDWWIDPDGFAIKERAGVLRWFIRDESDDEILWFDTEEAAKAEAAFRQEELRKQHPRAEVRAWSLTFFPGEPSPHMGPSYHARLGTLSLVQRERMQRGNWNIKDEAGTILRREWFPVIESLPSPAMRTVRGWDKGAVAGGDATEGAKVVSLGPGAGWVIVDIASSSGSPGERAAKMKSTATQDGTSVIQCLWQDPGSAGVYDAQRTADDLKPSHSKIEPATSSKVVYAEAWGKLAYAGHEGTGPKIYVMRAPWNDALFAEMDEFDGMPGRRDNKIDAISRAFLELDKGGVGTGSTWKPTPSVRKTGLH